MYRSAIPEPIAAADWDEPKAKHSKVEITSPGNAWLSHERVRIASQLEFYIRPHDDYEKYFEIA